MNLEPSQRLARFLALNRTVGVVLVALLCFGLGEQLWRPFMPLFLDALIKQLLREAGFETQSPWIVLATVGIYAFLLNFLEGFCYLGGGRLTAYLGDRGSLMFFAVLSLTGYVLFLSVPGVWASVLAAILILGWEPLSVPVTFTTVGSSIEPRQRGMAFAIQSIQKRLPKILGPLVAGFVLVAAKNYWQSAETGRIMGTRILVGTAFLLGLAALTLQFLWMPNRTTPPQDGTKFKRFHPTLRRLLLAEICTRWCDWLVREFVVLYLVLVRRVSEWEVGALVALQHFTALLTYLPIGRMTQTIGLQPFIGATFVFFALFPLVLALVPDNGWLALAFVVYGLREIGEPARKALITSLIPEPVRAHGIGMYWGLRSFAICWAPLVGAAVWYLYGPTWLLSLAFGMGCIGAAVYYFFCSGSVMRFTSSALADEND